jgi:1,4-alpha-glucan branching enzyme
MKYVLTYNAPQNIQIDKISVIGDFNQWNGNDHVMQKNDTGEWSIELELLPVNTNTDF